MNAYVLPNDDDGIDEVCNVYIIHKVPDIRRGKFLKKFITEDDRRQMTSNKYYRKLKETLL